MIRLLLSLLALITGVTVPGMAQACDFAGSSTEIGAQADAGEQASVETAQPQVLPTFAAPASREVAPAVRAFTAPRAPTVLIGIDRARQ